MDIISARFIKNSGMRILMSYVAMMATVMAMNRKTFVNPVSLCSIVGPGV